MTELIWILKTTAALLAVAFIVGGFFYPIAYIFWGLNMMGWTMDKIDGRIP